MPGLNSRTSSGRGTGTASSDVARLARALNDARAGVDDVNLAGLLTEYFGQNEDNTVRDNDNESSSDVIKKEN